MISVKIKNKAREEIHRALVRAEGKYEIGGLLLGEKNRQDCYISAVTVAEGNRSRVSFILNGEFHQKLAEEIQNEMNGTLEILGVWHSHICDGHNFSRQDMLSNAELAKVLGGAVSIIVTDNPLEFSGAYVAPDGEQRDCIIKFK